MSEELNQTEQPEVEPAFEELDALKDPEPGTGDYNPAEDDQRSAAEKLADEAARAEAKVTAQVAVAMVTGTLELVAPNIELKEDQTGKVADKLEAVLYKYGVNGLPPWLLAYREELELAAALGVVGFSVYLQVQAAKKEAAKLEAEKKEAEKDGKQPESVAS